MMSENARGALLGLAVGDALGTTYEFARMPEAPWSPHLAGPLTEVVGGGPFGVLPGQVTDDTMMAACLAASLRACDGRSFDAKDAFARYYEWSRVTFDIGSQTRSSLGAGLREAPNGGGSYVWERGGRQAAGNGSLMRTAPIGVVFANDFLKTVEVSVQDSCITHFDPRCALACAAFNSAIGLTVSSPSCSRTDMLERAQQGLYVAAGYFLAQNPDTATETYAALKALLGDLEAAKASDPQLYSSDLHLHGMQGFVRVAFRLAFWQLMTSVSFKDGLLDTVNRGGDADTNGAIVGALLGAHYGEFSIPEVWVGTVMHCDPPAPFHRAGALHPVSFF